jgi:hypothetical protein
LCCWLFYRLMAPRDPSAVVAEFPAKQQLLIRRTIGI